jgi:CysZ protein
MHQLQNLQTVIVLLPPMLRCVSLLPMDGEMTDPRQGLAPTRALRGAGYLGRGYRFVFTDHRELLQLCLVPLLINLVIFTGAAVGLYIYWGDIIDWIWPRPDALGWKILWYVLYVFIVAMVLLMGYVLFFALQGILSAPFNDMLSERVEQLAYGKAPPPTTAGRLARGAAYSLACEARKQGLYVVGMGLLLVIKLLVPVAGPVIFLVGGFVLSASFFCYDFMDFSMARRELSWANKRAVLKQNRALTLGFGAMLAGAMAIPLVSSVSMPMAAVGGTLLFCDLEQAGALEDVL